MLGLSEIAHARLRNQRLSQPACSTPAEAVTWLVASQSQDFAGAKWAVGMRCREAVDADVERAFDDGSILRTHMLRPTWHFVAPADIRWLLALTAPRVHAANGTQYRSLGLEPALLGRCHTVLENALRGGRHLTRDELRGALQQAGIATDGVQRSTYIMMHAELEGIICSGPRRGRQFTYALLEERVPRFLAWPAMRRWPSSPGAISAAAAPPPFTTSRSGPA